MNETFARHVEALHPKLEALLSAAPLRFADLASRALPERGIYLFTEAGRHVYVGRSNGIRRRLKDHCSESSRDTKAALAFRLAREQCGVLKASYKAEGSRRSLLERPDFAAAFTAQKARLRAMEIRTVEETDPNRQALLEMYASIALATPYNDFDTH